MSTIFGGDTDATWLCSFGSATYQDAVHHKEVGPAEEEAQTAFAVRSTAAVLGNLWHDPMWTGH